MGYRVVNGKLFSVEDFSSYSSKSLKKNASNSDSKNSICPSIDSKNNTCSSKSESISGFKETLNTFKETLDKEIRKKDSFTISNHAVSRLNSRNISLDEDDMKEINKGINMALEKGAKESLILYKDVALVASIKNRTIITALDKEQSKGNVFTNIDSVVLL